MTDKAQIAGLVERLEKATEGSRALDKEIARRALGLVEPYDLRECPAFTTSLDAALTLVPEAANCSGYDASPEGIDSYVSRNNVKEGHWLAVGWHKTSIPIALTIAALKARGAAS